MRVTQKMWLEALSHYRCPGCGECFGFGKPRPGQTARLHYKEVEVATFEYRGKHKRSGVPFTWQRHSNESAAEYAVTEDDLLGVFDESVAYNHFFCSACEFVLLQQDGEPVTASNHDAWQKELAQRWVDALTERKRLLAEIAKHEEDMPPVGLLKSLKKQVAELERQWRF